MRQQGRVSDREREILLWHVQWLSVLATPYMCVGRCVCVCVGAAVCASYLARFCFFYPHAATGREEVAGTRTLTRT